MRMLTSDKHPPVRGNAHAQMEVRGAMLMLTSDKPPPVRSNAHAHVR